jgi:hypothetical protein
MAQSFPHSSADVAAAMERLSQKLSDSKASTLVSSQAERSRARREAKREKANVMARDHLLSIESMSEITKSVSEQQQSCVASESQRHARFMRWFRRRSEDIDRKYEERGIFVTPQRVVYGVVNDDDDPCGVTPSPPARCSALRRKFLEVLSSTPNGFVTRPSSCSAQSSNSSERCDVDVRTGEFQPFRFVLDIPPIPSVPGCDDL